MTLGRAVLQTMFAGPLRLNLDPLDNHTDSELADVLDAVELGETVRAAGGLGAPGAPGDSKTGFLENHQKPLD